MDGVTVTVGWPRLINAGTHEDNRQDRECGLSKGRHNRFLLAKHPGYRRPSCGSPSSPPLDAPNARQTLPLGWSPAFGVPHLRVQRPADIFYFTPHVLLAGDHATPRMNPSEPTSQGDREITDLLLEVRSGKHEAMDRLFPLVYEQLRRIAHHQLQDERTGHTLGTTGVVHETYLKLVDQTRVEWRDRTHFFRVASMAMRRILVDYARRYHALRRGGGLIRVELDDEPGPTEDEPGDRLLAVDDALARLTAVHPRLGQVVECRYFGGLTDDETAEALGMSVRTVQRDWAKARAWLVLELEGTE
jgi:RNA polymerase sigma factor (TIGR02999 family)